MFETEDEKKQALNKYLLKLKGQRDGARDTQAQTQVTQNDVAQNTQDKVLRAQMTSLQDAANGVGAIGGQVAKTNGAEYDKALDGAGDEQIAGRNALNKQAIDAEARANKLSFDVQYDPAKLEQQYLNNQGQQLDNQVNQATSQNRIAQSGVNLQSSQEGLKREQNFNADTLKNQDANSEYSKSIRATLKQAGFNVPETASAEVIFKTYPQMKDKLDSETRLRAERMRAQSEAENTRIKADSEIQNTRIKAQTAATPNALKMGAEERGRLDNVVMGSQAIQDMANALSAGDNTFSLVGDNNYTESRRRFTEALGRMQSGGAITDDEVKKFDKMAPTITDSAEMQQRKLQKLQEEFARRAATLNRPEFTDGVVPQGESNNTVHRRGTIPDAD